MAVASADRQIIYDLLEPLTFLSYYFRIPTACVRLLFMALTPCAANRSAADPNDRVVDPAAFFGEMAKRLIVLYPTFSADIGTANRDLQAALPVWRVPIISARAAFESYDYSHDLARMPQSRQRSALSQWMSGHYGRCCIECGTGASDDAEAAPMICYICGLLS